MVDKVWFDWQNRYPENFWSFYGGSTQPAENSTIYPYGAPPWLNFSSPLPSDGIFEVYSVYDTMNTTGDKLCYVYE